MRKLIYFVLFAVLFSACNPLNPSRMMKTEKDFKFSTPPSESSKEYKVSPNDIVEFRIFTNDGFKLIDLTSVGTQNNAYISNTLNYQVEFDGNIKLPILGRIPMKGMTIREAELMLEDKYAAYYNKPFVLLRVINKRVIVFPGSGGDAKIVNLTNDNTTLLEALALAGGITTTGKAKKVKLIRGELKNPEVYLLDLSTIEGVKQADIVMQANDIIYVDPIPNISKGIVAEITPVISIITSFLLIYGYIVRFN